MEVGEQGTVVGHLWALDISVFGVMLALSIGIGIYTGVRRGYSRTSTNEYFLGGKNMAPVPVALSLLGGQISAVTMIGSSAEVYYYGTQMSTTLIGAFIGWFIVCMFLLPIFYKLRIVSLTEYLELRYGSRLLRLLATFTLVLHSVMLMGVTVYAPSVAITTLTSISSTYSIIILATICAFYTTLGGVRGVVYTDVLQTIVMLGGVLALVVLCCVQLGGLGHVWAVAGHGQRLQFFNMNTSPYIRHTFWSTVVMGFTNSFTLFAFLQSVHQRLISVHSLAVSQRVGWSFLGGVICVWTLFFFSGLVAYATYSQCDPLSAGKIIIPDQILPYLVIDKLGQMPGVPGVFVAAVTGAVLSTLSSSFNSVACTVWEDVVKHRHYFSQLSDTAATKVVRFLSALVGVISVGAGLLMSSLGNIFPLLHFLAGALGGPLAGIFMAGIFLPWVNGKGATLGLLGSFVFSVWLSVTKFLKGSISPPLPLSTVGCFNSTLNSTALHSTLATSNSTALSPTATSTLAEDILLLREETVPSLYDISYCYVGIMAVLLTMVIATAVSLITGPAHPRKIEGGLVNPTCERLYRRLYRLHKDDDSCGKDNEGRGGEMEMEQHGTGEAQEIKSRKDEVVEYECRNGESNDKH